MLLRRTFYGLGHFLSAHAGQGSHGRLERDEARFDELPLTVLFVHLFDSWMLLELTRRSCEH